jgi:hypothetical protein
MARNVLLGERLKSKLNQAKDQESTLDPSPATIILTPPPPPPADPAPALTDEAAPHLCLLPPKEPVTTSSAQNAQAGSLPQICAAPQEKKSRRARVQAALAAYKEQEPCSRSAPHYQTWRDAQTTKETNAQRRARYLLLYPHTGSADPRVMYHAIVDVLRKAGPGAPVKLQDIRSILGLRDVTLCSILESHADVFDFRGGDSVILIPALGKKLGALLLEGAYYFSIIRS